MAPAKWHSDDGWIGVIPGAWHGPWSPLTAKWTICAAMLLLALSSVIQAEEGHSTPLSELSLTDASTMAPSWPSKEITWSPSRNDLTEIDGQVQENVSLYAILTTLSSRTYDSNTTINLHENVTILEEFNSPESSTDPSYQSEDGTIETSGLNDTNMAPSPSFQSTSLYDFNRAVKSSTPPPISSLSSSQSSLLLTSQSLSYSQEPSLSLSSEQSSFSPASPLTPLLLSTLSPPTSTTSISSVLSSTLLDPPLLSQSSLSSSSSIIEVQSLSSSLTSAALTSVSPSETVEYFKKTANREIFATLVSTVITSISSDTASKEFDFSETTSSPASTHVTSSAAVDYLSQSPVSTEIPYTRFSTVMTPILTSDQLEMTETTHFDISSPESISVTPSVADNYLNQTTPKSTEIISTEFPTFMTSLLSKTISDQLIGTDFFSPASTSLISSETAVDHLNQTNILSSEITYNEFSTVMTTLSAESASDQLAWTETTSSLAFTNATSSGTVDILNQTSTGINGILSTEFSTFMTSLLSEPITNLFSMSETTSIPESTVVQSSETFDYLNYTSPESTEVSGARLSTPMSSLLTEITFDQITRTETASSLASSVISSGTSNYLNQTSLESDESATIVASLSYESTSSLSSDQFSRSETTSSLSTSDTSSVTAGILNQTSSKIGTKFFTLVTSLSSESASDQMPSSSVPNSVISSGTTGYVNQTSPVSTGITSIMNSLSFEPIPDQLTMTQTTSSTSATPIGTVDYFNQTTSGSSEITYSEFFTVTASLSTEATSDEFAKTETTLSSALNNVTSSGSNDYLNQTNPGITEINDIEFPTGMTSLSITSSVRVDDSNPTSSESSEIIPTKFSTVITSLSSESTSDQVARNGTTLSAFSDITISGMVDYSNHTSSGKTELSSVQFSTVMTSLSFESTSDQLARTETTSPPDSTNTAYIGTVDYLNQTSPQNTEISLITLFSSETKSDQTASTEITSTATVVFLNQTSPGFTEMFSTEFSTVINSFSSEPTSDQFAGIETTSLPPSITVTSSGTVDNIDQTSLQTTDISATDYFTTMALLSSKTISGQAEMTEATSSPTSSPAPSSETVDILNHTSPTEIYDTFYSTIVTSLSSKPTSDLSETFNITSSPAESSASTFSVKTSVLTNTTYSETSSTFPTTTMHSTSTTIENSTAKDNSLPTTKGQTLWSTVTTNISAFVSSETVHSSGSSTLIEVTTIPALHTSSHIPSNTTISHQSQFIPYTTAPSQTNISYSLFTALSSVSTGELSTVSSENNSSSTKMLNSSPHASYTIPTSYVTPLTSSTLEATVHIKTTSKSPTQLTTDHPTSFTPTDTHTPTTAIIPASVVSITTKHPEIQTHSSNTTKPVPSTVTSINTTKLSTTSPHNFTSALTSRTIPANTIIPVAPTINTTAFASTIATTPLTFLTTTSIALECTLSSEAMLKTVLTMSKKLTSAEEANVVQNWTEALNLTLYQVFKQPIQVLVNRTQLNVNTSNVTILYFVLVNSTVYIPSAISEVVNANVVLYISKLFQHITSLQSAPVLAEPWDPIPAYTLQLKTVLKLMGAEANIHSCSYVRNMEQKLEIAFEKAATGNFSVQILNTSQVDQALTLIYVVRNGSTPLNGTTSSSLLNRLTGEVVGYYLGHPPLIIAESLFYPTIDVSEATRDYWVNTVLLGVDDASLGSNNQSFARTMEERLANLFQLSQQQTRRFRRATTVGSYTVQMVKMLRLTGANKAAELTYYALKDGQALPGTVAAKQLSTIDPQTMALTLGYIVRVQAESVVNIPPNNLWIIAAVLAPIAVVTVIIIIITVVLCRKNKSDFKSENISSIPPRTKPVQGFDYAKQHLGQQGGDEEALPVTQETVVPSLNLSQERDSTKDGSTEKMLKSSETRKSRSPCENGSVISNESEDSSSDRSSPHPVISQHRVSKEEAAKRNGLTKKTRKIVPISDEEEGSILFDKSNKMPVDPFDSSSGSVQLIAIKPVTVPPDRNQDLAIINGEVNKALKQKSDIEHYRNKLRLKAKRKGYYDFPPIDNKSLPERKRKIYEKTQMEIDNVLDADTDTSSPFAEPKNRIPSTKNHPYRSRQSLNSPSPGETEMDLLVTREKPRRGIRNSGYDTEPEIIEETNVDKIKQARTYIKSRQVKGHSETSTLSSQPSIDEVRQQMHMLLEEAFSLASAGHGEHKRPPPDPYASVQHMPYSEVVTSAPGTMSRPRLQWVPTYGPDMYQYSLPRPTYRFSQLPEMVMGSPPPPVPPRTGPVAVTSLRRSTSDMANKTRMKESSGTEQTSGEHVGFLSTTRAPVTVAPVDRSVTNYSGNSVPAVFAIPGNRSGYTGYFIPQPPSSYRNQAWMPYTGDNELPGQWADTVPLPGYIEAYPRSRYPQNSPSRLPRQFNQPANLHSSLDHAAGPSIGASQQSLADTDTPDTSITNLSTAALVKAIREEVAKLAKKQTDMFEFQV